MTVKEYWEEAGRLRRRIDRKQNEIKSLRERAEGMTGAGFSDMPHTVSPDFNKMQTIIGQVIALEEEVSNIQTEYNALIEPMQSAVDAVEDKEAHDLLEKRYLKFMPWKDIISEMCYCKAHVYRLHNRALAVLKYETS